MSIGGTWLTDYERGYNDGALAARKEYAAEIERLRQIIADAPHDDGCLLDIYHDHPIEDCDCWKREVE